MMACTRSITCAALLATVWACSDPAAPRDEAYVQLSFEAIPGVGVALPQGAIDTSGSDYADKLAFTEDVFEALVPEIMAGVGVEPESVSSVIAPGGFLLETNPSMQTRMATADVEDPETTADRLAAALGYTMYQWSVLVTDFTELDGNTGYLTVRFTDTPLTPELAQQFFVHASAVDSGLGGGYMAFEDDMIFLNVRDDAGDPYSGLDDETFFAGLEAAASSFTAADVVFLESGFADAGFVGNDWESSPGGDDYLATVGVGAEAWLDPLQEMFAQRIDAAAMMYGWTVDPQTLRGPVAAPGIRRGHWQELATVGTLPVARDRRARR